MEDAEKVDNASENQLFSTQNDGRDYDEDKNLSTQSVALRELRAILRFEPADTTDVITPREVCLQLPIDLNSEFTINLALQTQLSKVLPNISRWCSLFRPNTTFRQTNHFLRTLSVTDSPNSPLDVSWCITDTKDHDRRRTVNTNRVGESPLNTRRICTPFRDVIHFTPLAQPILGNPSSLLEYNYFRLEFDVPEAQPLSSFKLLGLR